MDEHAAEGAGMALQQLLLSSVDEVQLDVAVDGLPAVRSGDRKESTPLSIGAQNVSNDLTVEQITSTVENLDLLFLRLGDADMVDRGGSDHSEDIVSDPSPEGDIL